MVVVWCRVGPRPRGCVRNVPVVSAKRVHMAPFEGGFREDLFRGALEFPRASLLFHSLAGT